MSATRATLLGALGFGLGWLFAGLLGDLMLLGILIGAAVGGAVLGVALGARGAATRLALAGAAGGGVGFFLAFFIVIAAWDPPVLSDAFVGFVGGAITGATLGFAWRGAVGAGMLALAGALGFALGFGLVDAAWPDPVYETCCTLAQQANLAARMALSGSIGGAALGLTAGIRRETHPVEAARSV